MKKNTKSIFAAILAIISIAHLSAKQLAPHTMTTKVLHAKHLNEVSATENKETVDLSQVEIAPVQQQLIFTPPQRVEVSQVEGMDFGFTTENLDVRESMLD